MANNSTRSMLSEMLQGRLAKNPALAAKQARLLKKISSGSSAAPRAASTTFAAPAQKAQR